MLFYRTFKWTDGAAPVVGPGDEDFSSDLPIVIEIVDTHEKIARFLPLIDNAIAEGLATVENVKIRFYRGGKSE